MFYQKAKRNVQCMLCPHKCILHEGKIGLCGVRQNLGGKIKCRVIGKVSGYAFDFIEKKPLYHFFPGKKILSVGSYGCNLRCNFCQNWQISLGCTIGNIADDLKLSNEIINDACSNSENIGVAYTYNEPTVWFEFMHEITMAAKSKGLKNVMVSNGFINESPLVKLLEVIDAFNIDLKAFTDSFYVEMAGGKLDPVLKSLKMIKQSNKHLEITNLLIPRKNDNIEDFADMVNWIANELGEDTVLHISRYFPNYKQLLPTTNEDALIKMHEIARKKLNYVYLGNIRIADYANTSCPNCDKKLIIRNGYQVEFSKDFNNGVCGNCGTIVLKPNHIR